MSSPPWSATVTGLMAAVGVVMPALITAPAAPVAVEDADVPDLAEVDELLPQAASTEPRTGSEMPTTLARRTKSRRDSRPAANSSITWLATALWSWRRRLSRRWSIFLVIGSLPGMGRILCAG